jgi:hypothetical protein
VDGHRRYAEEPDARWNSGPTPYESGVHERRPDDEYRPPEQRPGDEPRYPLTGGVESLAPSDPYAAADPYTERYRAPGGYGAVDPSTSTGSFIPSGPPSLPVEDPAPRTALDAIRVPLRATEYPAVRPAPGGSTEGAPAGPSTATGPAFNDPTGPAFNDPTGFVPPLGVRTADGPADHPGAGRSGGDGVYRTRRPVSAVVFAVVTALLMVPVIRLLVVGALADRPSAGGIVPAVLLTLGLPLTGLGLYAVAGAGRTLDRAAWLRPPVGYLPVGLILLVAAALATG